MRLTKSRSFSRYAARTAWGSIRSIACDAFEVLEALEALEGKGQFFLGQQMEDDEFVLAEIEVMERFDDFFRIVEEVADEDDQPALRDAFGDAVENGADIGIVTGFGGVKFFQNAPHLAGTAAGADEAAGRFVEGDQARGVALFDEQIRKRGGEVLGVFELGKRVCHSRLRRRCRCNSSIPKHRRRWWRAGWFPRCIGGSPGGRSWP